MQRIAIAVVIVLSFMIPSSPSLGLTTVFVSLSRSIVRFQDRNADGDFLDFAEAGLFAEGFPEDLAAIATATERLFAVSNNPPNVWMVCDRNFDGDALDFAEVEPYADVSTLTSQVRGLASRGMAEWLTLDVIQNRIIMLHDMNGDDDALDANEMEIVAAGLSSPVALTVRPDGVVLVAQNDAATPVRILKDRNGDGDYFDFAENLSYSENSAAVTDIAAPTPDRSFVASKSTAQILLLLDRTRDDDALDFGESIIFAEGLAGVAFVATSSDGTFAASSDDGGVLWLLRDLNGDSDALDFAEVIPCATGLGAIGGLAAVAESASACLKGDANVDDGIDTNDIAPFVEALIGTVAPADFCRNDMNDDNVLDSRDLPFFVQVLVGG